MSHTIRNITSGADRITDWQRQIRFARWYHRHTPGWVGSTFMLDRNGYPLVVHYSRMSQTYNVYMWSNYTYVEIPSTPQDIPVTQGS